MKKIPFWKMSGSGNDFVVIDNRRGLLRAPYSKWAQILCHRQFGVGADGLLLLENSTNKKSAFRMVYFNADGSRADMCGNGARCMAFFAQANHAAYGSFTFLTDAYPVAANVSGSVVQVSLATATDYHAQIKAKVGSKTFSPAFLNTGVPHAVVFASNLDKLDITSLGRALRFHRAFGPKGTNVNFVQKIGPHKLRVRTYERGVEGETLACGTGVAASAIAAVLRGVVKAPVQCVVAGGDTLTVNFKRPSGISSKKARLAATQISLRGPVRVTFKGEFQQV